MIIVFTFIFIYFIISDMIPYYKNRERKSFWTYMILLTVSFVLSFISVLEIKIPSPAVPIKKVVSALFGLS